MINISIFVDFANFYLYECMGIKSDCRRVCRYFYLITWDAFAATSWTMVMKRGLITGSLLENSLGFAMNRACRPAPGHVGLPAGKLLSADEPDSGRRSPETVERLQCHRALKPFSDVVGVVVNCQCLGKGQSLIEHTAFKGLFIVTTKPNFLMSGKTFNKPQSG